MTLADGNTMQKYRCFSANQEKKVSRKDILKHFKQCFTLDVSAYKYKY